MKNEKSENSNDEISMGNNERKILSFEEWEQTVDELLEMGFLVKATIDGTEMYRLSDEFLKGKIKIGKDGEIIYVERLECGRELMWCYDVDGNQVLKCSCGGNIPYPDEEWLKKQGIELGTEWTEISTNCNNCDETRRWRLRVIDSEDEEGK